MARILVVDDDARLRDFARRALTRLEHTVLEAGSVDEALERLAEPVDSDRHRHPAGAREAVSI